MTIARFRLCLTPAIAALALLSHPVRAPAAAPEADLRLKVMFLGGGGHEAHVRLRDLATPMLDRGIELWYTEELADLSPRTLAHHDVLMIYGNRSGLSPEQEEALLNYVADGGGLVAVHSASACFTEAAEYIELIGGEFQSHGEGVFRTEIAEPEHPIMQGFDGYESWDETYVHTNHNEENRTVLSFRRRENGGREPYTWVRSHGQGRVFYTAWGHDHRTWRNEGFHDLMERGIRWAADQDVQAVLAERPLHQPFEYEEAEIPYNPPGGGDDMPWTEKQLPLSPEDSMKRMITQGGFRVELVAAEPDIRKPIAMAWDERGRLWVAETQDYPNELRPEGEGRDRISILEDTDGDGRADAFTVFAEDLNIPTSLAFHDGGVLVHQAPVTLFLKDTDGDDKADVREVIFEGWSTDDSHGGPNNLEYGLDNRFWGTVGDAAFEGVVGGEDLWMREGFYRFKPDGSEMDFLGRAGNNTWGLGFNEEGGAFISAANRVAGGFLMIPWRYYDLHPEVDRETLEGIVDTPRFLPVTHRIRQVDNHGSYTSASGHSVYTARTWPKEYWNRIAFVNGPTGHLTGELVLEKDGAGYRIRNPRNLIASDDEWFSPVFTKVGPDGHVWLIDWYNFILQHSPTPEGFETGPGKAYETELRDKRRGRIYRIVWEEAEDANPISLADAGPRELVRTLANENQLWRLHAQRLLVERGRTDVGPQLLEMARDSGVDTVGLNVGVIHALWTLHGLGELEPGGNRQAHEAAYQALRHRSAGVRRNAVQVLPADETSVGAILEAGLLADEDLNVRLVTLLALADMPASKTAGEAIFAMLEDEQNLRVDELRDAATLAAMVHPRGFLAAADEAGVTAERAREAENLLPNPSFEQIHNGRPVGWSTDTWAGSGTFEVAEGEGRHGGNALKIRSGEGADAGWLSDVNVELWSRYLLSGWIRTEDVGNEEGRGAQLSVMGVSRDRGTTRAVTGDADWTYLEREVVTRNDTGDALILLLGGWGTTKGTVWFDDVSLTPVGSTLTQYGVAEMVRRHATELAPEETAAEPAAEAVELELGVIEGAMKFDKEELRVEAGQKVRLVFRNTGVMEHNFLLLKPGTLEEVGRMADEMVLDANARERQYVPDTDSVLEYTSVVLPDEQFVLELTAPEEPGKYPYVCTYPGHWRLMQGTLIVE